MPITTSSVTAGGKSFDAAAADPANLRSLEFFTRHLS